MLISHGGGVRTSAMPSASRSVSLRSPAMHAGKHGLGCVQCHVRCLRQRFGGTRCAARMQLAPHPAGSA
jgi:hypothetical protein